MTRSSLRLPAALEPIVLRTLLVVLAVAFAAWPSACVGAQESTRSPKEPTHEGNGKNGANDGADGASPVRERVVLENERLTLTVVRATRSGTARVRIASLATRDGAASVDLSKSPLFRATLVDLDERRSGRTTEVEGPSPGSDPDLPEQAVRLESDSPTSAVITYSNLPVPNSKHRLNVRMRVDLGRPDGAVEWTATATLEGAGSLVIGALDFPVLRIAPIGGDSADDAVLLPMTGGLVLDDPIAAPRGSPLERQPFGGESNFHYPGYMDSQFVAYYDDGATDAAVGCLYLAAEDPAGYTKAIHFLPDSDRGTTELLIGHYSIAPDPLEDPKARPVSRLRTVDVGQGIPYRVVTDLFVGDWMTAADRYRTWVEQAHPVFLAKGPLHSRKDMPAPLIDASYALAYTLPGGERALGEPDPAKNPDLATLRTTIQYLSDRDGAPMPCVLTVLGDMKEDETVGNANDNGVFDLREGFVDFLAAARANNPSIAALLMNRDVGNWELDGSEFGKEVLAYGVVTLPNGRPLERGGPEKSEGLRACTCNGSQYVMARRLDQFRRTFERTKRGDGNCITGLVLSGRGTESHLCYAPMALGTGAARHHHTIGGGTYFIDGYRSLVQELQRTYGATLPHLFPAGERSHEQLIDTSILSGRLRLDPWDDLAHAPGVWVEGARPVPLVEWLYHDFAQIDARLNRRRNVAIGYAKVFYDGREEEGIRRILNDPGFLLLERRRFAAATVEGRRIGFYVEGPGSGRVDAARLDGPPGAVPGAADQNYEFLREMIRLHQDARPWLGYGRMLRPARVTTDEPPVKLALVRGGRKTSIDAQRVLTSAWRSPSGDIAFVVVNDTGAPATARLSFDPASYGLTLSASEKPKLEDLAGEVVALERTEGTRWTTGKMPIGPERPGRVLVLRRGN